MVLACFDGTDVFHWNITSNHWALQSKGPWNPRNSVAYALDPVSGTSYIFGGRNAQGNSDFNDLWTYDYSKDAASPLTANNPWNEITYSGTIDGRWSASASYSGGSFWYFGGQKKGNSDDPVNELYEYDIGTETFTQKLNASSPWPPARVGHAQFADERFLYIFGGTDFETGVYYDDLWRYEFSSNSWTQITPRSSTAPSARQGGSLVILDTDIFLFGGEYTDSGGTQTSFNELWTFDFYITAGYYNVSADDPDDGDCRFSSGDTITLNFFNEINQFPVGTKADLDSYFSWSEPIGTDYTGAWSDVDILTITIVTPSTASPGIGSLTMTVLQSFTDIDGSEYFNLTSNALQGDWGQHSSGPALLGAVAKDPTNANTGYGLGDTLTIMFNEPTSQPPVATKADINGLFQFSESFGDYTGTWTNSTALTITVTNTSGAGNPQIGSTTVTVRDAMTDPLGCASMSQAVALSGDFGTYTAPCGNLAPTPRRVHSWVFVARRQGRKRGL
eukprot:TRINITY_DN1292_c1_g1_i9.p1 TRINITY_DN1292_c1_g1~~TRINITY_DN1292_c1_g1_i9.p1  ORF type:complete len:504 (+),score=67.08 TRINITY_DN1292_c1_g1_i9:470-1981(+)